MKTVTYEGIVDDFPDTSGKFLEGWHYFRFWQQVSIGGEDECWLHKKPTTSGYGSMSYKDKGYNSSRLAYLDCNGPIPKGHLVRHTCDVRACCNPKHLVTGTGQDNASDRVKAAVLKHIRENPK